MNLDLSNLITNRTSITWIIRKTSSNIQLWNTKLIRSNHSNNRHNIPGNDATLVCQLSDWNPHELLANAWTYVGIYTYIRFVVNSITTERRRNICEECMFEHRLTIFMYNFTCVFAIFELTFEIRMSVQHELTSCFWSLSLQVCSTLIWSVRHCLIFRYESFSECFKGVFSICLFKRSGSRSFFPMDT